MTSRIIRSAWILATVSIISGMILAASIIYVDPVALGAVGVTAWFLDLLLFLSTVLALALTLIKTYLHVGDNQAVRVGNSWRQGLLIGGWAVCILALSSLGQLSLRDGILLGLLCVIVEIYMRLR